MTKAKQKKSSLIMLVIIAFIVIVLGIYLFCTGPVDKKNTELIDVSIESGTSVNQIADILKDKGLIRSPLLFKIYVKIYDVDSLKAATYQLSPSMNLKEIIEQLEKGSTYNPNLVVLTFKEGERITDFAKTIEKNTNTSYDEVLSIINDKEYLNTLINEYWFLTPDILNADIYYPLEGYLAPDTYHFENKDVEVKAIIKKMLDEMDNVLEPYQSTIINDVHKYMTMASIVELEGTNTENRKMIVGIFNNRLNSGMNMGSDVTTYYGLQVAMTSDLTSEQFASTNAYNTRSTTMIGKLPVGPICSPSKSSIEASLNPTASDYLFFVADKNGKIYYTKTMQEHDQKIAEIKAKGDWIW